MKTKHEIEIEELPEGWRAVAYMVPREGVDYVLTGCGVVELCHWEGINPWLVVEKIKPHRTMLEETGEERDRPKLNTYTYFYTDREGFDRFKVLREVKEGE